jgi:hypothetical protein
MFTAEQYRAKATEYAKLMRTATGPAEVREYRRLERSFTELADNAQWVTENSDKMVPHVGMVTDPKAVAAPAPSARHV